MSENILIGKIYDQQLFGVSQMFIMRIEIRKIFCIVAPALVNMANCCVSILIMRCINCNGQIRAFRPGMSNSNGFAGRTLSFQE